VAVLGLGKTVDGDFLSSDDVELVETIAGYVAVALDDASARRKVRRRSRFDDVFAEILEACDFERFLFERAVELRVVQSDSNIAAIVSTSSTSSLDRKSPSTSCRAEHATVCSRIRQGTK